MAFTEKELPQDWQRYRAQSLLGGVLASQRKFAEAEPLLLAGYDGLSRLAASLPPGDSAVITEAAQRLVAYYTSAGQPEKAAEWSKKLAQNKEKP